MSAAPADATTMAAIVGGIASILTIVISKWLDSSAIDRREAVTLRRDTDREKALELEEACRQRDEYRDRCLMLHADNAVLRSILLANKIPFPPPITQELLT